MATDTAPRTHVAPLGFLARLAAYVLDVLVVWAIVGVLGGGLWAATIAFGAPEATAASLLPLIVIGVLLVYYTVLHAHGRQTVGKRLLGGVVVDNELRPIGYGQSLGRLLAEILSAIPVNLGYLWALWDRNTQTFHDKLADTLVVRKDHLSA